MHSLIRLEDEQVNERARLRKFCAIFVDLIPSVALMLDITGRLHHIQHFSLDTSITFYPSRIVRARASFTRMTFSRPVRLRATGAVHFHET